MIVFQYYIKEPGTSRARFPKWFWDWYFTFANYLKTKYLSLKDTSIPRGYSDQMPLPLCLRGSLLSPSSSTEVGRKEPEIAHNHAMPFYCTSNMCCHYFSFWSSHGSIASEDNGAYYFRWAPSGGFNGPAITGTKTHWEATLLSCHQNGCEFVWS